MSADKGPRYKVWFKGVGYTASDANNPNGVKVRGEGYVVVPGERPKRNVDIPFDVVERCKAVFMKECLCVRYAGDTDKVTKFPTVWLGAVL